jgi:hypothetical protein
VALIVSILVLVTIPALLAAFDLMPNEEEPVPTIVVGLLTFHLPPLLILILVLRSRVAPGARLEAMDWRMPSHPIRDSLLALLVIFPSVAVIFATMQALGVQPEPAPYVRWLQYEPLAVVALLVVAAAIIAPLTEELLFRLVLNGALEPKIGRIASMHVTALIFAVCHGRPTQIPVLYAVALVLQYLRNSRRSILSAIFAHAAYNGTMLAIGLYWLRVAQR